MPNSRRFPNPISTFIPALCTICQLPLTKLHEADYAHDATLGEILARAVALGVQPSHRARFRAMPKKTYQPLWPM